MNARNFYGGMESLSDYFCKKLTQKQQDFYFNELDYIDSDSFDHAIQTLQRTKKPTPGFFPTIDEIRSLCPVKQHRFMHNGEETEMDYYKRVTIDYLWSAHNILNSQGDDAMVAYCKQHHINDEDVERVRRKLQGSNYGKIDVKNMLKGVDDSVDKEARLKELQQQALEITS